jgi:hypothetical protein
MNSQDPLAIFRPNPPKALSDLDIVLIEAARTTIHAADSGTLSNDNTEKYKDKLVALIYELSPNKIVTASYLMEHVRNVGLAETWVALKNGCVFAKTSGRRRERERTREMMEEPDNESQNNSSRKDNVGRSAKFSA